MKTRKSNKINPATSKEDQINFDINCFIQAARTISMIDNSNTSSISVIKQLGKEAKLLINNDLSEIEYTLLMQAKTLDHLFHQTIQRVTELEMVNQMQIFADIALRAQNLSRKTYLALADLKCPKRTTFIKQQNNAINQQINNHDSNSSKIEKPANELLETNNGKRLDSREEKTSIQANPSMEAMEQGRREN